jgi:hypothetical protein
VTDWWWSLVVIATAVLGWQTGRLLADVARTIRYRVYRGRHRHPHGVDTCAHGVCVVDYVLSS